MQKLPLLNQDLSKSLAQANGGNRGDCQSARRQRVRPDLQHLFARFPYACAVPGLSNHTYKTHWLEQRRCPEEERHESCEGNSPCDWPAIANGCLKAELHSPRIPKSRAPKRMAHTSSGPCAHSESRARSESNPNSPTRTQSPRQLALHRSII